MEEQIITILIQGGLASVALLSLWINYKIVSNHINHANDALNRNTVVLEKLHELIKNKLD